MVTLDQLIASFEASSPPSAGQKEIVAFESQHGFELPSVLRQLLAARDGGDVYPCYRIRWPDKAFVSGYGGAGIAQIFGLRRDPWQRIVPLREYFTGIEASVEGVPAHIYTFADDWGGNILTFDAVSGDIGFVDHETFGDRFDDPGTYWVVANGFDDLLQRLEVEAE